MVLEIIIELSWWDFSKLPISTLWFVLGIVLEVSNSYIFSPQITTLETFSPRFPVNYSFHNFYHLHREKLTLRNVEFNHFSKH